MIEIEINQTFTDKVDISQVERAALTTLNHQKIPSEACLTIVITDDAQLQQLNLQYLKKNFPTDVLSFPAGFIDPETNAIYLGDILISYPQAQIQAKAAGHPVETELNLLVIHAVLHLLGYDHFEIADKKNMWTVQSQILFELGFPDINLPL